MVLGRGTSAGGMDLCGLTISILPAVCTSTLLRGSASSLADIRLVRSHSLTDSPVVHDSEVKYHCTEVVSSMSDSISIVEWQCIVRLDIYEYM